MKEPTYEALDEMKRCDGWVCHRRIGKEISGSEL